MNDKKTSSFISSIFKFSISTWVNTLLYVAAVFLVNIFIDKTLFGMFDLMISTATTLMSVVTLGFDHAYLRFYKEPPKGIKDSKQIALLGLIVSVATLTIVSTVIFLIPDTIGKVFFEGRNETILLVSACLTCLAMVVIRFFNICYRVENNILKFSLVSILLQFFIRVFYIFGSFIKKDLNTIVIFNLIGLLLFVTVFFFLERKTLLPRRYEIKKEAYAPLFRYSLGIMPSSVLLWGNQLVSKLFVGAILGDSALGLFSFASLISYALGILQGGFATFWSAYMFTNYKTENERIKDVHDILMLLMMVLMCLLIILSPLIFIILSSYSGSREVFGLLLYAPLLMIVAETTVYGIEIAKKTFLNTISSLICVATNILFCSILVPRYSIPGAAISLVASTAAMFLFRTIMSQKYYRSIRSYLKTTVSLLVMGALSFASFFFDSNYLLVFSLSVAALLFYVFSYMNEVKEILAFIRKTIVNMKTSKEH